MKKALEGRKLRTLIFLSVFVMGLGSILFYGTVRAEENRRGEDATKTETEENKEEEINWGTLKVKGLENVTSGLSETNVSSYDFTYSLEGADPNTKVTMLESKTYTMKIYYEKATDTTGRGSLEVGYVSPGRHSIKFHLYRLPKGDSTIIDYEIPIRPRKVADVSLKKLTAWQDVIEFRCLGNTLENGDKILLQQKKDGEWTDIKTFKAGAESGSLTDLKPDTEYSFRLAGMASETGTEKALIGEWSKTLTLKTGKKERPVIGSVSVWGTGQKYRKERFVPGHFVGDVWVNDKTIAGGWTTTANFKIVLKKKPAGSVGAVVFDKFYKLKGNTILGTVQLKGAKKGKSFPVQVTMVRHKDYKGYSLTSKVKKVVFR